MVDEFLRRSLRKGIPSLFTNLKGLYRDPVKVKQLETLVLSYLASLRENRLFSPTGMPPHSYFTLVIPL